MNLLQQQFDIYTEMFINGFMEWNVYEQIEFYFNRDTKLFTICLN